MISRARPSTVSRRPITERSPPNRDCQYPFISMIVSGVPGLSSRPEKQRPSAGEMPNSGKVASVTKRMSTFSGSPRPVTLAVRLSHTAMSRRVRFCSR